MDLTLCPTCTTTTELDNGEHASLATAANLRGHGKGRVRIWLRLDQEGSELWKQAGDRRHVWCDVLPQTKKQQQQQQQLQRYKLQPQHQARKHLALSVPSGLGLPTPAAADASRLDALGKAG